MRAAMLLLAVALALSLPGCGKRGSLEPPDDQSNEYPRVYPPR